MSDPMKAPHHSSVRCNDSRPCFAKVVFPVKGGKTKQVCTILVKGYKANTCPFCKPRREVTNGKTYPYDYTYTGVKRYSKE